jgi:type VI secretion system secreted protein VgrG
MADFARALPFVLQHEGGWSDDPDDPGGATNQGITLATAQRHGIMTKDALRVITPEVVAAIYEADYWRFGGVYDQRVATKLFDMTVNMGRKTSVKLVQNGLNELGASLIPDGCWGPATENCVNAVDSGQMLEMLCRVSEERYRAIVADRPKSAKYLNGWLKRAAEVPRG